MRVNGTAAPDTRMRPRSIAPRDIKTRFQGPFLSTLAARAPRTRILPRRQSVLIWAGRSFDRGAQLLETWSVQPIASAHHQLQCRPDTTIRLWQRRQPAHDDGLRHLRSSHSLGDLEQQVQPSKVGQERSQVFASHTRGSCCRALLRRSEVSVEHILIQLQRDLRNVVQNFWWQRFPGLGWPPGHVCEKLQRGCPVQEQLHPKPVSPKTTRPPAPTAPRGKLSTPNRPVFSCELCSWTVRLAHHQSDWPRPNDPTPHGKNPRTGPQSSRGDIVPHPGGRCNNILGNIENTFHARVTLTSSTLAMISSSTIFMAFRNGPFRK